MVVKIEIEIIRNELSRAAGGFDYNITSNWDISAGLKWQPMFDDWRKNPVVISIGAAYKF